MSSITAMIADSQHRGRVNQALARARARARARATISRVGAVGTGCSVPRGTSALEALVAVERECAVLATARCEAALHERSLAQEAASARKSRLAIFVRDEKIAELQTLTNALATKNAILSAEYEQQREQAIRSKAETARANQDWQRKLAEEKHWAELDKLNTVAELQLATAINRRAHDLFQGLRRSQYGLPNPQRSFLCTSFL